MNDGISGAAPRTAWTNALRAEVLRVGKRLPEVARVAQVGVWLGTYADADGSNAFPGREVLATLAGCSLETVSRAVRVLVGVGALERKRRPNTSSMYRLRLFLPGGLPWEEHLHHYTDTRQRRDYAQKKAEAARKRKASTDAVREGEADSVRGRGPDSVHGGGSEPADEGPDSVHGRPRNASVDAVRTASVAGGYKVPPTCGRDQDTDKDPAGVVDQPQKRAGARAGARDDKGANSGEAVPGEGPVDEPAAAEPDLVHCGRCGVRLIRGGTLCARHKAEAEGSAPEPQAPVQGAFPVVVPSGPTTSSTAARAPVPWPREDPSAPTRICGCGRTHRAQQPGPCPDCVAARHIEQAGAG